MDPRDVKLSKDERYYLIDTIATNVDNEKFDGRGFSGFCSSKPWTYAKCIEKEFNQKD